jgi:peptidoglycan/LPS O-acetylase OafA/YrhL
MPSETQLLVNRAHVSRLVVQTAAGSSKAQRIPALDFTKGTLVLLMVLYHWLNYFTDLQWEQYRYLHFLTPSFIFISGFMISNVYLSKYDSADPRLSKRLFTRAIKIMAVFLILNLARTFVTPLFGPSVLLPNSFETKSIFTIFISGNLPASGGKIASFFILVPISYLLAFSGALMLPYRCYRYTFHFLCLLLLSSILILGLFGAESTNLELVTIGMLGVLTGFMPVRVINDFVRHPYVLAIAYMCYTIAITIWSVPFVLLIVGVSLNLLAIYLVGSSGSKSGNIRSKVILLGKYSLFGYISQIAILQILSVFFHRVNLGPAALGISFCAAFALTMVSVEVVDRARARVASVDRLYKAVFA